MIAKLIESSEALPEAREIPITKEEFLIGRGADCDLRLGSSAVSRHHCMLRLGTREATVMDLGSSNGTFLNGQRVRSQAALHSGDELRLGTFVFVLLLGSQEGISWYAEPGNDPNAATLKLSDARRQMEKEARDKEKGPPPAGAAGQPS